MRQFKDNEESSLEILRVVGKGIDSHGQEVLQAKWQKVQCDVSLGSLAKPNKEILKFKYDIPQDRPSWVKDIFG